MKSIIGKVFLWSFVLVLLTPVVGTAAEKTQILVGAAIQETGKFSGEGKENHNGMVLWVDDVNAKGGIFVKESEKKLPVKLVTYDDRSDTSTCVKLYERLITVDNVDLLLPPWGSANHFAVTAVTEKHKFPLVMGSAAAEQIFSRGFKYLFETAPLTVTNVAPFSDYLGTIKPQIKTIAILYENHLFPLAIKDSLEKALRKAEFDIAMMEQYPIGCTDFSSVLTKVRALDPDALFLLNIMPSSIYATKQMIELGIKPRFYMVNIGPTYSREFTYGIGDFTEGVCETGYWISDLNYKGAKDFAKKCLDRFKREDPPDSAWPYMAGQILEQAIEKAGTLNHEKINNILHSEEFYCIGGPFKYDEKGVNIKQKGFMTQVQGRKRVIVWPPELANAKMIFPKRY